jgi:hypothetical protein
VPLFAGALAVRNPYDPRLMGERRGPQATVTKRIGELEYLADRYDRMVHDEERRWVGDSFRAAKSQLDALVWSVRILRGMQEEGWIQAFAQRRSRPARPARALDVLESIHSGYAGNENRREQADALRWAIAELKALDTPAGDL